MKNSKLRRALLLVASAILLVSISVSATLAYLTSKTNVVTNTFSVGNVTITLDEAKVTEYGEVDGTTRVTENTYKLIPGHTYKKDPTIHVDADSEECWLFVKVVNPIVAIEAPNPADDPATNWDDSLSTIEAQMASLGWSAVAGETNVYAYRETVSAGDDVQVFWSFKINGEVDVAGQSYDPITVRAYAVQADGFNTAADAWTAAPLTAEQWAATN